MTGRAFFPASQLFGSEQAAISGSGDIYPQELFPEGRPAHGVKISGRVVAGAPGGEGPLGESRMPFRPLRPRIKWDIGL